MKFPLILFVFIFVSHGFADTWAPPPVLTVSSQRGDVLVRVVPTIGSDPLTAIVFDYDKKSESYVTRTKFPLRNQWLPYRLAVSSGATRVVAVEDYGAIGYGKDSIAIYDGSGRLLWRWALSDIFTKEEIARIPSTTSSRLWVESVDIDGAGAVAVIRPPITTGSEEKRVYWQIVIDLATGKLTKG